jgi:hypothetical protein
MSCTNHGVLIQMLFKRIRVVNLEFRSPYTVKKSLKCRRDETVLFLTLFLSLSLSLSLFISLFYLFLFAFFSNAYAAAVPFKINGGMKKNGSNSAETSVGHTIYFLLLVFHSRQTEFRAPLEKEWRGILLSIALKLWGWSNQFSYNRSCNRKLLQYTAAS